MADCGKSRRQILLALTQLPVFSLFLISPLSRAMNGRLEPFKSRENDSKLVQDLIQLLPNPEAAKAVAHRYLHNDATPADLYLLSKGIHSHINSVRHQQHQLRSRLKKLIKSDFLEGRVHRVEGWQLAKTELELCLIVCLMNNA